MSEPRLISPLLDDFLMGDAISSHHGVCCCPAIKKETEEKYIVKVISLPASPKQLAALLLSGAYHSREAALNYYKDLADDTVREAELLQKLSRLEGFSSFDGWQIEQTDDGFDVYLTGPYHMTLERKLRKECLTHLAAVNLGLDLCAALSVSRRNGHLYVDLKPENIFISDSKGYLIGDLGFIGLRSLKFASLPEKYRSPYTAPEITDAYSALNDTLDIYAAGMILYQVYNGGQLPQPGEELTPPAYADYEMAEIILKACDPNPENRWQDPQQMGQAIAGYMQRNTVNDDPIIPPPPAPDPAPVEEELPEETENQAEEALLTEADTDEEPIQMEEPVEKAVPEAPETDEVEDLPSDEPASDAEVEDVPVEQTEISSEMEEPDESPDEDAVEAEPADDAPTPEEPEQFVIDGFLFDETLPSDDNLNEVEDAAITDEVSQMLAQADELIAHKAPEPVVAPEPIEIPIPEPILPEPEEEEATQDSVTIEEPQEAPAEEIADAAPVVPDEEEEFEERPRVSRKKLIGIISALLVVLLLLGGGFGVKYYYDHIFVQHMNSITCTGAENWLTVTLDTEIDNSLLTVYCTDTYGNKHSSPVRDNMANFSGLASGTTYKISVAISGRHHLLGPTTAVYTTAKQTVIEDFRGSVGDADGTVILTFSVRGPDSSGWKVVYSTDGEEEKSIPCSNHMAIVTGLTVGKDYNFRLVPGDPLYVVSGDTLTFTAPAIIQAEDLQIHGFDNGSLLVTWKTPAGVNVPTWTVRCWSSSGFDQTYTVTDTSVAIPGLDVSVDYTVEVKAEGMTVSKWAAITAGSITFKDTLLDNSDPKKLVITWPFEGTAPEGGWKLVYTVNGSDPIEVICEKNTFTLEPLVPGAHYEFSLELPTGITVFGDPSASFSTLPAPLFDNYGVRQPDFQLRPCLTPGTEDWSHKDLTDADYTDIFQVGDAAGLVLNLTWEYQTSPDTIHILFVFRSTDGKHIEACTSQGVWTELWFEGYCELNIPALPATPGEYELEILFNGTYITGDPMVITVTE